MKGTRRCRVGVWTKVMVPFALEGVCADNLRGAIGGVTAPAPGRIPVRAGRPRSSTVARSGWTRSASCTCRYSAWAPPSWWTGPGVGLRPRRPTRQTKRDHHDDPRSVRHATVQHPTRPHRVGRLRSGEEIESHRPKLRGAVRRKMSTPFRNEFVDLPLDGDDAAFFSTTALHVGGVVHGKVGAGRSLLAR